MKWAILLTALSALTLIGISAAWIYPPACPGILGAILWFEFKSLRSAGEVKKR